MTQVLKTSESAKISIDDNQYKMCDVKTISVISAVAATVTVVTAVFFSLFIFLSKNNMGLKKLAETITCLSNPKAFLSVKILFTVFLVGIVFFTTLLFLLGSTAFYVHVKNNKDEPADRINVLDAELPQEITREMVIYHQIDYLKKRLCGSNFYRVFPGLMSPVRREIRKAIDEILICLGIVIHPEDAKGVGFSKCGDLIFKDNYLSEKNNLKNMKAYFESIQLFFNQMINLEAGKFHEKVTEEVIFEGKNIEGNSVDDRIRKVKAMREFLKRNRLQTKKQINRVMGIQDRWHIGHGKVDCRFVDELRRLSINKGEYMDSDKKIGFGKGIEDESKYEFRQRMGILTRQWALYHSLGNILEVLERSKQIREEIEVS